MDLSIIRHPRPDGVELVLTGRLDSETTDDLRRAVDEELRRGLHAIRLDLSAVGFLSSAAIRGLFETQRAAKAAGGTCLVSEASPVVRKVLDLTRLTPLLMGTADARPSAIPATAPADVTVGPVRLVGLERPATAALRGELIGSPADAFAGRATRDSRRRLPRHSFAIGLGALADEGPLPRRAGELAALDGVVYQRPAHQHAAVDFVAAAGDLVAEADILAGLVWQGVPSGRAGFEPATDEPAVAVDDVLAGLLQAAESDAIAFVLVGEVQGLVGAELIRPLAEAAAGDSPLAGTRGTAARWLSFSREPVFARHTAAIVGVCCGGRGGRLEAFVRPIPGHDASAHAHAVVFPYRPLRRAAVDLAATVADLAGSEPLAVMHLMADPQPVLGSGRSELVRGCGWFAPLHVADAAGGPHG